MSITTVSRIKPDRSSQPCPCCGPAPCWSSCRYAVVFLFDCDHPENGWQAYNYWVDECMNGNWYGLGWTNIGDYPSGSITGPTTNPYGSPGNNWYVGVAGYADDDNTQCNCNTSDTATCTRNMTMPGWGGELSAAFALTQPSPCP